MLAGAGSTYLNAARRRSLTQRRLDVTLNRRGAVGSLPRISKPGRSCASAALPPGGARHARPSARPGRPGTPPLLVKAHVSLIPLSTAPRSPRDIPLKLRATARGRCPTERPLNRGRRSSRRPRRPCGRRRRRRRRPRRRRRRRRRRRAASVARRRVSGSRLTRARVCHWRQLEARCVHWCAIFALRCRSGSEPIRFQSVSEPRPRPARMRDTNQDT